MSALTDPISDLLTCLRNSIRPQKVSLSVPYSKIKSDIVSLLKKNGYIDNYHIDRSKNHLTIKIFPRYVEKKSAILGLKRVSRPGLRRYVGVKEIPSVIGGLGIAILSTPLGVISGHEAHKKNVGGELLAFVW